MATSSTVVITLVIDIYVMLSLTTSSHAVTYATNMTASTVESSSVVLTWITPDDPSSVDAYRLTVLDESLAVVLNVSIDDVATTSYDVMGLVFSTWHNASLKTLDASGNTIGQDDHSFLTAYDPLNFRALCALGVVGGLILTLVAVKIAAKVWNPDKAAEEWKQEILLTKQKEREERKKKLSSQAAMSGSTTDLGLV